MSTTIERDDLDYDELHIPIVGNGPIGQADSEKDDAGWSKGETWVMQAESSGACGDDAVGPYYSANYTCGPNAEGEYMVVEESYYVTAHRYAEEGQADRTHFDVTGMYGFTLCTDPGDPGSSEVTSDYEYDDGIHALFIWDYEQARALAERLALSDTRGSFTWNK